MLMVSASDENMSGSCRADKTESDSIHTSLSSPTISSMASGTETSATPAGELEESDGRWGKSPPVYATVKKVNNIMEARIG